MWYQIVLCLFVGLALATNENPAWKENFQYTYEVRGRTLSSLHDISNQHSGILLKAKLTLRSRPDGSLTGKILNPQYGQIHSELPNGCQSYIPDESINYRPLGLSGKSFKVIFRNGIVQDLVVDKDLPVWETNIIKSIISQIQLDTKAENRIDSYMNAFAEDDSSDAVFNTLEDTVTGISETLYEIHPLPELALQSEPYLVPLPQLKENGEYIEVIKTKNFSRSIELPEYYYGLGDFGQFEPGTNKLGQLMTRTSISRAVVTGRLQRYTIQSSVTINQIVVSPRASSKQKGSVISVVNITLSSMHQASGPNEDIANPVSLGHLVYSYQGRAENKARASHTFDSSIYRNQQLEHYLNKFLRSNNQHDEENDISASTANSFEEKWDAQDQPQLNEFPKSPLLPYTTGYMGGAIKKNHDVNIVHVVIKLAREVAQSMDNYETIPEQGTLSKFAIMTSLIRTMNRNEIEEVSQILYNNEANGIHHTSWVVFRDAVAEAGTGPSFLVIISWIESKKIQQEEAAEVWNTMIHNIRQPTEGLVRAIYNFAKSEINKQHYLNETAILTTTELIRKVYVDTKYSHVHFPVHSFGKFQGSSSERFVKDEIIPFLEQKLQSAIAKAESSRIHTYIRALGNLGHPQILRVFEPYLEGNKQVSQFQRLLMVVSMDQLTILHPKSALSVLSKVYQNRGEIQEIRIAAVYQIMKSRPSAEILQKMALYTHIDMNPYVNAAVASAIEHAVILEGVQFENLRRAAEAARPLINQRAYGFEYPSIHIHNYFVRNLRLEDSHAASILQDKDSFFPKSITYSLWAKVGDLKRYQSTLLMMVSSVDEMVNIWEEKTQDRPQSPQQSIYSSENIAKMLKMQSEPREQLEGLLMYQVAQWHKFMSFDNHTFDRLPENLRQLEDKLSKGQTWRYQRFTNPGEIAIAFPTESGLPFLYTFDMPTVINIDAQIKSQSTPKLFSEDKIRQPNQVTAQVEFKGLISTKMQAQFGFFTPFDQHKYIAGYDKNIQLAMPIKTTLAIDLKKHEIELQVEAIEPKRNSQVFHYSSWPYTAFQRITSFSPVVGSPQNHIIKRKVQHQMDHTFGKEETGFGIRVQVNTDQRFFDFSSWMNKLNHEDVLSMLISPMMEENLQHTLIDVDYVGETTVNSKLHLVLWYDKVYMEGDFASNGDTSSERIPTAKEARRQNFLRNAKGGLRNPTIYISDIEAEFQGKQSVKYTTTALIAKNSASPKSRVVWYVEKHTNIPQSKPFQMVMTTKNHIPIPNELNYDYAFKFDPTIRSQIQIDFGETLNSSKVAVSVELKKSEERKRYLIEQPMHTQCKREIEQGNHQLSACSTMLGLAKILDHVNVRIEYERIGKSVLNSTYKVYGMVRQMFSRYVEEDVFANDPRKKPEVSLTARFHPDMKSLNVSVYTNEMKVRFWNLPRDELFKSISTVYSFVDIPSMEYEQLLEYFWIKPECVVDYNAVKTYDSVSYPSQFGQEWVVIHQYVPQRAEQQKKIQSVPEQLRQQRENYAVMIRNQDTMGQKEIKITLQTAATRFKTIDITIKPLTDGQKHRININDREQQMQEGKSIRLYDGLIEIYPLPNGETMVEIRSAFDVIYDGARVKIKITNGSKFRGALRGICGNFNGLKTDEFLTPEECVIRDHQEFIKSFTLSQNSVNVTPRSKCVYKKNPQYVNVITHRDMHQDMSRLKKIQPKTCTLHQTRYVEENNKSCFSLRPLPVCSQDCREEGSINKSVEMFCVNETSEVTNLWKSQIDKGGVLDFSMKSPTKNIKMKLPQSCKQ